MTVTDFSKKCMPGLCEYGRLLGGLYCTVRCPDVVTMMTLMLVAKAPVRPHNECSFPCFLSFFVKPKVLIWSRQSVSDSTRGDGLLSSQFLQPLLTHMMSSRPGTVFFVAWMKLVNWQSGCRPWSCLTKWCWSSKFCMEWRAWAISSLGCSSRHPWVSFLNIVVYYKSRKREL